MNFKTNKVHFTSLRGDWKTPKELYKKLDEEFHFDFDPCPTNPKFDGLSVPWGKINFVNPPYGRKIWWWIHKAIGEYKIHNKIVVLLVPSRTDTVWWHMLMAEATEIRFIRGRLHFDDQKNPAPFPSAVVILK